MKKATVSIIVSAILVACLFAGCNGADGGKITDTQQNLSDAMTEMQDMITNISEAFTTVAHSETVSQSEIPSVSDNVTA